MSQTLLTPSQLLTLSGWVALSAGNQTQKGPDKTSWIQFQTYNEIQYGLALDPPDEVYTNQLLVAATNTWGLNSYENGLY